MHARALNNAICAVLVIMAATQRTWQCQLSGLKYALLFDLVGHVRAAHSADCHLSLICQVNGCPRIFKNTNTWYKHVRAQHKEEYFTKEVSAPLQSSQLEDQESMEVQESGMDHQQDEPSASHDVVSQDVDHFEIPPNFQMLQLVCC